MRAEGKYNHRACQNAVFIARNVYHKVWVSACAFDNVPIDSKFVVFSNSNPFVYYVNKAYEILVQWIYEYQNGSYVGLKIRGCTAKERKIQKEQDLQNKISKFNKLRRQLKIFEAELN
jgi:hypothetical protein